MFGIKNYNKPTKNRFNNMTELDYVNKLIEKIELIEYLYNKISKLEKSKLQLETSKAMISDLIFENKKQETEIKKLQCEIECLKRENLILKSQERNSFEYRV